MKKAARLFRLLRFRDQLVIGLSNTLQTVLVAAIAAMVGGTLACVLFKPVWMWVTWLWAHLY